MKQPGTTKERKPPSITSAQSLDTSVLDVSLRFQARSYMYDLNISIVFLLLSDLVGQVLLFLFFPSLSETWYINKIALSCASLVLTLGIVLMIFSLRASIAVIQTLLNNQNNAAAEAALAIGLSPLRLGWHRRDALLIGEIAFLGMVTLVFMLKLWL
jgi:hypothetical protein